MGGKKIWLWNHYATGMFSDRAGRHYCFAKYLSRAGHSPTVFCASTIHNTDRSVELGGKLYKEDRVDEIPFFFVKAPPYKGNGLSRIRNMLAFARNVKKVAKEVAARQRPDVILASSVHPFTCVAGLQTAKRLGVPCVVEIRDLWPESIVEVMGISRKNPVILALYQLEKWIYKKADRIVFTMEGGKDYIVERGWDKVIDLNKVRHVNNGVDLEEFDRNAKEYVIEDKDLDQEDTFKVVYTGSIRAANNPLVLLHAAQILQEKGNKRVSFFIYGDGESFSILEQYQRKYNLSNVFLKGRVDKKNIPYILSKADVSVLFYIENSLCRFGGSQNKLFEYFASGSPVLSNLVYGYDLIQRYDAGRALTTQDPQDICDAITMLANEGKERLGRNARNAAADYDFKVLTEKLEAILEEVFS